MKEIVQPIYKPNIPAIVFTIDDGYVPYFSVALTGLLKNSSTARSYDIVVLYRILSAENKKILLTECQKYANVSLRFYNIDELIKGNYCIEYGAWCFIIQICHFGLRSSCTVLC